ncbi:MAG: protoporphyrinogen oxidase [Thermoguttaceae bacterium]|nr:protoporphyrinogen oxidase [Thermoguttaceae bacterium]MDW8039743.1 protoporphyrinogen oxidase [Thermoguttaceae bacterium]
MAVAGSGSLSQVTVVGAGISGLSAAYRIRELAPQCKLTVLEAQNRLGGVIQTIHLQGYQIELSADNFITTLPWALELCGRLGLSDQLVQTNPACRRTFVVHRGRLHPLPEGFLMMAPSRWWPLVVTPLLTPLGKLRAAMEYFLPPRRQGGDESVAQFARRRFGRQAYERLIEPLVSAVYGADLEKLSLEATLGRFRQMELQYGSLIRAMRSLARQRRSGTVEPSSGSPSAPLESDSASDAGFQAAHSLSTYQSGSSRQSTLDQTVTTRTGTVNQGASPAATPESGARYSMFVTLRDGLSSLIEALARSLPHGTFHLQTPVEALHRLPDGTWQLQLGGPKAGHVLSADAVLLAVPAHAASKLLQIVDPPLARLLAEIPYTGTAIVAMAFDQAQVGHPLDGMGAVIPAKENSPLLAISFSNRKYPHRAPVGKVLLRSFLGGAAHPELLDLDDQQLREVVLSELRRLLLIQGQPSLELIARWPASMPQYPVGHKDRLVEIRRRLERLPGLALAGNAYQGIGLPDCIHTAQQAAEGLLRQLGLGT